jgi:hypothetical protein
MGYIGRSCVRVLSRGRLWLSRDLHVRGASALPRASGKVFPEGMSVCVGKTLSIARLTWWWAGHLYACEKHCGGALGGLEIA